MPIIMLIPRLKNGLNSRPDPAINIQTNILPIPLTPAPTSKGTSTTS